MADINSLESKIYEVLFEQAIEDLPSIQFNQAAVDIASAINVLGDAMEIRLNGGLDPKSKTTAIINQTLAAYDSLKKCPEHAQCFTPLNKIASKLGENITNIFNILQTSVKPEMDSLKKAIEERSLAILKDRSGRVSFEPTTELATDTFSTLNWDEHINVLGGVEAIVSAFKDVTGMEANFIISDLSFVMGNPALNILNLADIDANTRTDILTRVTNKIGTNVSMEVEQALNIILNSYDFQGMIVNTIGSAINSNEYSVNIQQCLAYINGLYPMLQKIKSTPLDVTDELLASITNNVDVCERALRIAGYVLLIIRKHYEGSLIISTTMLNGDELPKYLNDGGSMEDIARFVYVYYTTKNIPIPFSGIQASEVKDVKDDTNTKFGSQIEADKLNAAAVKHSILIEAARQVMTEHLESTDPSRLPSEMNLYEFVTTKKSYIQTLLNQLDTNGDNNLENMLYEFIIYLWYDGTMVRTAHEIFGTEMVRQLDANPDLTKESIAIIDATVASTIISRFIVKELCVKK